MAEGLQYKENLTLISGGYPGENPGSDGVVQDWTETTGDSGSSTVTYHYNDSAQMTNANSTYVEINITDTWTATRDNRNYYHITVSTTINYIRRTKVGSPSPLSVYMFARHDAGGANIWTSGGCVDAANSGTNATNINMGTTTIDLAPGQSTNVHGTVYFRSNICGHNNAKPPSIYVDEFWLGVNFRNTLPPDYRPGKTWNGEEWLSHNREAGYLPSRNLCDGISQNYWLNAAADNAGVTAGNSGLIIAVSQNTDYTVSTTESQARYRIAFSDQAWGGSQFTCYNGQNSDNTSSVITKNSGAHSYLVVNATDLTKIQVEKGSTATPYVPYGQFHASEGASDIYTSSSAKRTMRTKDGGVGTDDAPFIKHTDAYRNQREIGLE